MSPKWEVGSEKWERPGAKLGVARRIPASRFALPTSRAFTLIEVITTLVVIAIIGTIASRVTFQAFAALNDANTRSDLVTTAAPAMNRIVNELRTIGLVSTSNPVTPDISSMTASSITFNATTSTSHTIALSGSTITLSGDAVASAVLARNVTSFVIQGYDKSNAALPAVPSAAQIATLRRIQITITVSNNGVTETLRTKVFVRAMASGSNAS